MIDTHCHLDDPRFDADRDAVVTRARDAGVVGILVPGVRPASFGAVQALARRYPEVRLALGVHPQVVHALTPDERRAVDRLPEALAAAGAVAVGECGLDGAYPDRDGQERLFRRQIAIAREVRRPLVVHVFRAHDLAPRILAEERAGEVGGVLHSYSGGAALVGRYRDLGLAFGFAGPVTYPNARRPVEAARLVPPELLLAETDAPDQAPAPRRGGRSEPAFVVHIVEALAAIRDVAVEELAALVTANARRLLGVAPATLPDRADRSPS